MKEVILVINAGSSSIKFSVFISGKADPELHIRGQVEGLFTSPHFVAKNAEGAVMSDKSWGEGVKLGHEGAIEHLRVFLREHADGLKLAGVGHRVAHGGLKHFAPVRVNAQILSDLEVLVPLAPLHQPNNLAPIRLVLERMPDVPQVGVFDTAFHHSNPQLAQMFGLPKALTEAGVRRYGFHGISYEYIASALPKSAPEAAKGRTIVLHLGSGSSMCALDRCRSVATTMGFSALDGLVMGTRCGALDPGVILYLLREQKLNVTAIEKLLYSQSGLLGVSGISSDLRVLLESNDPQAKLALDLFIYRIGRELGSLTAALGGLDAIVFTAGIGENSAVIRERVCQNASWLGINLDPVANGKPGKSGCVSKTGSRVAAWVLPTNEELMIARHTARVLGMGGRNQQEDLKIAA